MGWKELPYWIKGGIIGLVIGIVGSIFSSLFIPPLGKPIIENFSLRLLFLQFVAISVLLALSGIFGCNFKRDACTPEILLGYTITIIVFALLGTLIGLIIGNVILKK